MVFFATIFLLLHDAAIAILFAVASIKAASSAESERRW
jgi:hypothetical protein